MTFRNILIGVGVLALLQQTFSAGTTALANQIQLKNISDLNIGASFSAFRVRFNLNITNQSPIDLPGTSFIGSLQLGGLNISSLNIQNINLQAGQDNRQAVEAEIPFGQLADNIIELVANPLEALNGLTITGNLFSNGVPIPLTKRLI